MTTSLALRRRTIAAVGRLQNAKDLTNLLQVVVSVGVAVAIAAAALLGSVAAGHWQDAVRAEVRWSAAMLLDTSHVYRDEAPWGVQLAVMQSRADALEIAARQVGRSGGAAMAEAQTLRLAVQSLVSAQTHDHLIADTRYRSGLGFDLGRRLGDLQKRGGVARSARSEFDTGDALAAWARVWAGAAVAMVLLYLLAHATVAGRRATARRRRRTRRSDDTDVGLVPHPWRRQGRRSASGVIAFAAWILVTLLPAAQIEASLDEQRLQSQAAALAVDVASTTQASSAYTGFALSGARDAVVTEVLGLSRQAWAMGADPEKPDVAQLVIGESDRRQSAAVRQIVAAMAAPPDANDGVPAETVRRLTATPDDWQRAGARQANKAAAAQAASVAGTQIAVALLLAALALSIATIAGTFAYPRKHRLSLTSLAMVTSSIAFALLAAM